MSLYKKHKDAIDKALDAINKRTYYAAYPESPKAYEAALSEGGEANYKAMLNKRFQGLLSDGAADWVGEEASPYTGENLGVLYPMFEPGLVVERAKAAMREWKKMDVEERAGLLVETLERIKTKFFEIAYATMHTSGQSFMMSFQASGPHSADRAMEPIALGLFELTRFPKDVKWVKPMGKFDVTIEKTFTPVPKGIGLVVGCSTFPVWNTLPGVFADLITGNGVIVKPHQKAVLPAAICVAEMQQVFRENNVDPYVVQLAADTSDQLITKHFTEHPDVRLIDYTGSSGFGNYIESLPGKTVFTEKAGVNSVIVDSVKDLDAVLNNLAFSVSLYSGQMCTAPQNFFIPESGVKADDKHYTYEDVIEKLKVQLSGIAQHPKMGVGVLGALQNPATLQRVERMGIGTGSNVALAYAEVKSEEFPSTRTVSPLLLQVTADDRNTYENELFGPIAVVVKTRDTEHSVALAKELARTHGAITCGAYSTDNATIERISEQMNEVFVPVTFNLTGPIWVNQHAAFSDFHVTGGNPAGNASYTNPEFVIKRFVWVGNRKMV